MSWAQHFVNLNMCFLLSFFYPPFLYFYQWRHVKALELLYIQCS